MTHFHFFVKMAKKRKEVKLTKKGRDVGKKSKKRGKKVQTISDSKIRLLWHDPDFSGQFGGITSMKISIWQELGIKVTSKQVARALTAIPSFVMTQHRRYNGPRRSYSVSSRCVLWQADLMFLPSTAENKGKKERKMSRDCQVL